ncbi:hypothetical protein JCM9279_003032 [Rhodotorula babjevae]
MDDMDAGLDESYFSSTSHRPSPNASLEPDLLEPDASFSSASSSTSSPDSLAGAPFTDVEARALEFLSASPPKTAPTALFRLEDLPRPVPSAAHDREEAHAEALEFLRRSLDEADKDEWRYRTPAVFAVPSAAAAVASPSAGQALVGDALNVGLDDDAMQPWQDRAFNVERWQVDGLEGAADGAARGGGGAGVVEVPLFDVGEAHGRFEEGETGFMT